MKKILFLLLVVTSVIVITGCSNSNKHFKLRIKESSWSGWIDEFDTDEYEPEEITTEYDVVLGKEYTTESGKFTFTVEKVKKNYIIIKTPVSYSDNEEGIDLRSTKKEFEIYLNKEKELTTPTTDGGDIFTLTLLEK